MDIFFLQFARVVGVLFGCETDQAVIVHVDSQRIEARHQNIHAEIVLQTIDKVWIGDILSRQVAFFLGDALCAIVNFNTATAACSDRFEDPQ